MTKRGFSRHALTLGGGREMGDVGPNHSARKMHQPCLASPGWPADYFDPLGKIKAEVDRRPCVLGELIENGMSRVV